MGMKDYAIWKENVESLFNEKTKQNLQQVLRMNEKDLMQFFSSGISEREFLLKCLRDFEDLKIMAHAVSFQPPTTESFLTE